MFHIIIAVGIPLHKSYKVKCTIINQLVEHVVCSLLSLTDLMCKNLTMEFLSLSNVV